MFHRTSKCSVAQFETLSQTRQYCLCSQFPFLPILLSSFPTFLPFSPLFPSFSLFFSSFSLFSSLFTCSLEKLPKGLEISPRQVAWQGGGGGWLPIRNYTPLEKCFTFIITTQIFTKQILKNYPKTVHIYHCHSNVYQTKTIKKYPKPYIFIITTQIFTKQII